MHKVFLYETFKNKIELVDLDDEDIELNGYISSSRDAQSMYYLFRAGGMGKLEAAGEVQMLVLARKV